MRIIELLRLIAARPSMYFGEHSIYSLQAFIDGFLFALEDSESENFMRGFQIWVQNRFEISTSQSWARIIAFFSTDEAAALDEAIKLLLEYCSEWEPGAANAEKGTDGGGGG